MSQKILLDLSVPPRSPDEMALDLRRLADAIEANDLSTLPARFSMGPRAMDIDLVVLP